MVGQDHGRGDGGEVEKSGPVVAPIGKTEPELTAGRQFDDSQPAAKTGTYEGTPGRTRTCDLRFRKPMLYPLSYGGGWALEYR